MKGLAALGVLVVLLLSACGGGSDGRFDDDVTAVREAVEAEDATAAEQALETLSVDALAAHEDGVIDDAELQEIAALVAASRAELAQILPTTTTTTTTTAPPPPVVEDDEKRGKDEDEEDDKDDDKDDKDDDEGRGNGNEGGGNGTKGRDG